MLYHFTDPKNVESICKNGLMSASTLKDKGITATLNSDASSRAKDAQAGLEGYVRLSFCSKNPMQFVAKRAGRISGVVTLCVKLEVISRPGVLFSDVNANSRDVKISKTPDDVRFEVVKAENSFRVPELLRKYYQAEVLIPGVVPPHLIAVMKAKRNQRAAERGAVKHEVKESPKEVPPTEAAPPKEEPSRPEEAEEEPPFIGPLTYREQIVRDYGECPDPSLGVIKVYRYPLDGKRSVPPLYPNCKECQGNKRACKLHEGIELCQLSLMCRNVKAARRCEACCSGLEICHEHMVLCRKEAHIACNYCLLYLCYDHAEAGCCEEVETRRKQIEEIARRKREAEEAERAKREAEAKAKLAAEAEEKAKREAEEKKNQEMQTPNLTDEVLVAQAPLTTTLE